MYIRKRKIVQLLSGIFTCIQIHCFFPLLFRHYYRLPIVLLYRHDLHICY